MHSIPKKWIFSYIRTKRPYERYQVDLVEFAIELNMKDKFQYLCTWVDNFIQYAWTIHNRNKEIITVKNSISHAFISENPEILMSDN